MLDTDQLRSFMAIVDTGSFTRAAERVHKTQSAVSMHIRRLEEQLGRPLFVKSGRGVKLSGDGERLVEFAREMLRIEAEAMMHVGQKGLAGQVRLGIPDDYAEVFMPAIMEGFARKHPFVEVSVICEGSQALAERVRSHELDIALVTDCAAFHGVEIVREEPLVWVAHPRFNIVARRAAAARARRGDVSVAADGGGGAGGGQPRFPHSAHVQQLLGDRADDQDATCHDRVAARRCARGHEGFGRR